MSLTERLDAYRRLVAEMPVGDTKPYSQLDLIAEVRGTGSRVTDRLLPGASPAELDAAEQERGRPFHPVTREWFGWSNGHAGGMFDLEDPIALLFPFTRHLTLAEAVQCDQYVRDSVHDVIVGYTDEHDLLGDGDLRYLLFEHETEEVVIADHRSFFDIAVPSVEVLVDAAIDAVESGFSEMNEYGAVVFREDWGRRPPVFAEPEEEAVYARTGLRPGTYRFRRAERPRRGSDRP